MDKAQPAASETSHRWATTTSGTLNWERVGILYARIALGAAFLSGIASRFGLYGKNVGYGNFANFVKYTAEVHSFMPAFTIPFLAWSATAAELVLGIALILGVWPRWVALGSAALLALFALICGTSRDALASAGAVLLVLYEGRKHGHES